MLINTKLSFFFLEKHLCRKRISNEATFTIPSMVLIWHWTKQSITLDIYVNITQYLQSIYDHHLHSTEKIATIVCWRNHIPSIFCVIYDAYGIAKQSQYFRRFLCLPSIQKRHKWHFTRHGKKGTVILVHATRRSLCKSTRNIFRKENFINLKCIFVYLYLCSLCQREFRWYVFSSLNIEIQLLCVCMRSPTRRLFPWRWYANKY